MTKKNILILDPERDMADLLARVAESRKNAKCYVATRDEEAEALFKDIPFDLVFIDLDRAKLHDYRLLLQIRQLFPSARLILLAFVHQHIDIRGIRPELISDVLFKPINIREFRSWLAAVDCASPTLPSNSTETNCHPTRDTKCHLKVSQPKQ